MLTPTIENIIATIKSNNKIDVYENMPPYITVVNGKHKNTVRLGKFLTSFGYSQAEIKQLVEEYKKANADISKYTVEYTTDYEQVYTEPLCAIDSTSISCMTNRECVSVYSYDPKLSLLIIKLNEQIVARTLVRFDKKEYIRIYHNSQKIPASAVIKIVEDIEGFTEGDLEGIELGLEYDHNNNVICPYLDGLVSRVNVQEESLLITKYGDYDATNITGYIVVGEICQCCGSRYHTDDMYYVETEDSLLCEECLDENYIYFDKYSEYVLKDSCVTNKSTNELVPEDWACDNLLLTEHEEWYSLEDTVIIIDEDENEFVYALEDCKKLAIEDKYGNEFAYSEVLWIQETSGFPINGYYTKEQVQEIQDNLQLDLIQEFGAVA